MSQKPTSEPALDEERLGQMSGMFFRDKALELIAGYRAIHPDYPPGELLARMWPDSMRMGQVELAEAQTLARRGSTAWANFARSGVPEAPGLPAYSLDKRETMLLDTAPHIANDPLGADRMLRVKLDLM